MQDGAQNVFSFTILTEQQTDQNDASATAEALNPYGRMKHTGPSMEAPNERRSDDTLRSAVSQLTQNLREVGDKHSLYARALSTLCKLSESPCGFVVERAQEGDALHITALLNDSDITFPHTTDVSRNLAWLKPSFNAHHMRVFQASDLNRDGNNEASMLPVLTRVAAIPLADANNVHAVICLANTPAACQVPDLRRYWPFISSITAILRLQIEKESVTEPNVRLMRVNSEWQNALKLIEAQCLVGVIRIDREHNILALNKYAERLFKQQTSEVENQPLSTLIPERFPNEHKTQTLNPHSVNADASALRLMGRDTEDTALPLDVAVVPMQHMPQEGFFVFIRDCSEVSALRAEFNENHQRLRAVSDLAPIGIMQADLQWDAQYVNDQWCDLFGLSKTKVMGNGWLGQLFGDNVGPMVTRMHEQITEGHQFKQEVEFPGKDGQIIWADFLAHPVFQESGKVSGFVATLTDQSFRHHAEKKLRDMAEHDALTGLANRTLFTDRLRHALQRVERHGAVALLCLDLDGFKNINDSLGHSSGDELLIEVAQRLRNAVRTEDTVARVGGDEFLILIEDLENAAFASQVAEKILHSLKAPTTISHQEIFVSTSIGIAFATSHTKNDPDTLIKQADMALYRAKNAGRNNYQYYSPELEFESRERLELGNSLHNALARAEFEVHYQMQADVKTGTVVGLEALLRWRHPKKGLLGPDTFIPLLEETGIIVPTTRWVFHTVLADLKYLRTQGLLSGGRVAVNLSPRLLRDSYLIKGVTCALKDHNMQSDDLIIEITETSLLEDSAQVRQTLNQLRANNIKIALDDFGTGYSSLTYLKNFPIDELKIDKSFVMELENDEDDRAITQAVLALAKSLKISTTAEGVENEGILSYLQQWGCDHYQGYLLNKPAPMETLVNQLKATPNATQTPEEDA